MLHLTSSNPDVAMGRFEHASEVTRSRAPVGRGPGIGRQNSITPDLRSRQSVSKRTHLDSGCLLAELTTSHMQATNSTTLRGRQRRRVRLQGFIGSVGLERYAASPPLRSIGLVFLSVLVCFACLGFAADDELQVSTKGDQPPLR
jgi:hypothetical protein